MYLTNDSLSPHANQSDSPPIVHGPRRPDLIRTEILADLFEATAARIPNQTALISGDQTLSYGQLDQLADRAASRLIAAGVRPGHIVGLWLPRGLELLTMQLAIAKTGAAWLPLDADTPVERIAVCLDDADAVGIVSCNAFAPRLAAIGRPVWAAETLLAESSDATALHRRQDALPEHPAYVIYTSGSTGKPKGIAITQGSICHFLRSENELLGIRQDDRVYQGFSVAFDMSFEEIWISYLVGATLWIAPKSIASDAEALPQALIEQRVSVLHAVPTLLALFDRDVPSLRLINLGGEMCPATLVERWATADRQVFNSYGPTEATVSASMAQLKAGEPVTIGLPLPNYAMLVIAPEMTGAPTLLPLGEVGELCITGPGVAAGYLGRPELTAEKFLPNPWATDASEARLYRTGDLARIDADGRVHCLGRTDDQIKIRGFRVELGEIEAALAQQPNIGTVAVVLREVQGVDQLIAFLVAETAGSVSAVALRTALAERLPPYMVPSRFELLPEMPRLTSGKIDRKTLKAQPLSEAMASAEGSDVAQTPAETALFEALAKLFPGLGIRRNLDFFDELGGHSLLAARLASLLRTDPRFTQITVRDIYKHRTVGGIAAALQASSAAPAARVADWTPPSAWRRWRCGIAQAAAIPGLVALRMGQWLAPFFTYHFYTGGPGDSIPYAIWMSMLVFLLSTVLEFAVAIAGKWLVAGRLKPGRYPLWGMTYFRWWLADRLCDAAPTYFINGSSLQAWWLRALGARIGEDVNIGSAKVRAPDLLSVGDGASVGNAVNLENARVMCGELLLGPIDIGAQAHIGSYAVLEGNTRVEDWGHLDGQSALSDGQTLPARRIWSGSPARDVGAFDPASLRPRPAVGKRRLTGEALFFVAGAMLVAALFFLPVFPTFMLIDVLDDTERFPWLDVGSGSLQLVKYFGLALLASPVMIVLTALISAGIRWSVLPRLKSGSWPVHSNVYCGKWLVNQIQESSLQVLHGVYATLYAPFWYRLLGAKVGRNAEISTALGVVPDMLTLGEGAFIADAVLLGDEEIDGGWMSMQPTVIGRRTFIGNGAYIPDGTTLPENVLIGVLGRAPDADVVRSGDTWLGSPALRLPAREVLSGHPESLTFHPSPLRRLGRGVVEAFRIVVPHAIVIAAGYSIVLAVMPMAAAGNWGAVLRDLTMDGLIFGLSTFVFVALFKWLFLRRYKPRAVPMWTPFVWLSEAATNIYEGIAVPNFMNYLRGTPWLPMAFNLLGTRIGRGVYLDTTDLTEFDCVRIGDYSELNAQCCPQTHLFEDRVMKIHHVDIGSRVNIGPRSTVLYGAVVHDGAQLGPLTLVMKGESIPPASRWSGNPAVPTAAG
ncbi:amino acid adenylation domain-containing protein [Variovorax sp. J22R133]|uniref:Pls/PosA family non-ribosomal peptide synthetase n=1 Tax=Variovorax brevis TaxID=3053503 RepID=UPI0025773868|nr:Pls/PosA family non-ribosomal peptide synthetase [Variovorax sp. J22R133]MDM0110923.1 amino acid adenylation domain-containing protein [Variovorax sp. J22R133]